MLAQVFMDYLLKKGLLSAEQAAQVTDIRHSGSPSLMDLAVDEGYMTAEDVERYLKLEDIDDEFENIAIDEGFLTQIQIFDLLRLQSRRDIIMTHMMESLGIMPKAEVKKRLADFCREYELSKEDYLQIIHSDVKTYLDKIIRVPRTDSFFEFAVSFVNIVMHCIEGEFLIDSYRTDKTGEFERLTALECAGEAKCPRIMLGYCGDESALLQVAKKYSPIDIPDFSADCADSLKELLNCAAGIFVGVMERKFSLDYDVMIPEFYDARTLENPQIITIKTKFGRLQVVFTQETSA